MRGVRELALRRAERWDERNEELCVRLWRHKHPLLKANLVIAQLTPMDISKRAWTFGKMDLKSSKSRMRVLFTSIKHNFFQKLNFILTKWTFGLAFFKTWFLGWKSWNKRALIKEICNNFYFIFIFSYIKWVEGGICSLVLFMGFFFFPLTRSGWRGDLYPGYFCGRIGQCH